MLHMLLIVEPLGQRAERGREAGEAVYQRMLDFSAELQEAGCRMGHGRVARVGPCYA